MRRAAPPLAAPSEPPLPPPAASGTIRGLAVRYLQEEWASRLGPSAWAEVLAETGLPDPQRTEPFDPVSARAFVEALHAFDRAAGRGDGALLRDLGRGWAHAWAKAYRSLAARLKGDPRALFEVLATEIHPWLLDDPGAARVLDAGPASVVLELHDPFPSAFRLGLLEGFAEVAGVAHAAVGCDGARYAVSWEAAALEPAPSRARVLARALRATALPASIIPALLGAALAWRDGYFFAPFLGLTLLGVACLHLGANALNDYFDRRADARNPAPTPFSGGSRVLQRGLLSPRGMLALGLAMMGVGAAAGLLLGLQLQAARGIGLAQVLGFGAAGVLLGVLYSAPPARLAHRGLGEAAVGLGFGPLVMAGAYVVQSMQAGAGPFLNPQVLFLSVPVGALVAAMLLVNEVPDRPWDAQAGKRTLAVRLRGGRELLGYAALLALAYGGILAAAVVLQSWTVLLALLTAPLALWAGRALRAGERQPAQLARASAATVVLHLGTGLLLLGGVLLPGLLGGT